MLGAAWANHRDELIADFQQTYGLDATELGRGLAPLRAAALASQLPPGSRTMRALAGATEWWSPGEWLLWSIEYHLRAFLTDGAAEPLPSPMDGGGTDEVDPGALADALGIPEGVR